MLNIKQLNKIESRIDEIEKFLDNNRDYNKFDSNKLFNERSELLFKRNKDNINFRLSCNNKYSINIGSNQYGSDLKRFSSKEELLGFVIGFNEANNL